MDNLVRIKDHLVIVEAARHASVPHIIYTGISYTEKSVFNMENVHFVAESIIKAAVFKQDLYILFSEYLLAPRDLKRAVDNDIHYILGEEH